MNHDRRRFLGSAFGTLITAELGMFESLTAPRQKPVRSLKQIDVGVLSVGYVESGPASRPAIRFQVMLWPVTDANFDTDSYHALAEGHFLSRNMMKWFWDNYAPDIRQRQEIYASPLRATIAQLKGLPPALIQVAENDVLRDEGERTRGSWTRLGSR